MNKIIWAVEFWVGRQATSNFILVLIYVYFKDYYWQLVKTTDKLLSDYWQA